MYGMPNRNMKIISKQLRCEWKRMALINKNKFLDQKVTNHFVKTVLEQSQNQKLKGKGNHQYLFKWPILNRIFPRTSLSARRKRVPQDNPS